MKTEMMTEKNAEPTVQNYNYHPCPELFEKYIPHPLEEVFEDVLRQVEDGKGRERHGTDPNFMEQPIIKITEITGLYGPSFQVMKKLVEAIHCFDNGTFSKNQAYQEVLGSIAYLATIAMLLKRDDNDI